MLIDVESDLLSLDDVESDSLSLVEPLNDVDVLMESDLLVLIESLVATLMYLMNQTYYHLWNHLMMLTNL